MPKAIIVYSSRTGQTKVIGEFITEGLRISGIEVDMFEAGKVTKEADLAGYDAYIFGSPTYHGEMMSSLKTFLFLAKTDSMVSRYIRFRVTPGAKRYSVITCSKRLASPSARAMVDAL